MSIYNQIEERVNSQFTSYSNAGFKQYFMSTAMSFGVSLLILAPFEALVLLAASYIFIGPGQITIGVIFSFIALVHLFISPIGSLEMWFRSLSSSLVSYERLDELLSIDRESMGEGKYNQKDGMELRLENISFKYNDDSQYVLEKFSCRFEKNKLNLIKAKSGIGKTTLLDILFGLYAPENGSIYVNGQNLSGIDLYGYRSHIAYLQQEPFILDDTLFYNLQLADEHLTKERADEMLRRFGLGEWLEKLPLGLDTILGERGVNMSVGQKQRLSIIQAMLRNCKVIILDEPSSALDKENEQGLISILCGIKSFATVIVVSHSPDFEEVADKIIDLNQ